MDKTVPVVVRFQQVNTCQVLEERPMISTVTVFAVVVYLLDDREE